MSYKDPEDKKRWSREWKRKSKKNGYNQWLYARRKIRFEDALHFRNALESIALKSSPESAQALAMATLEASKRRWEDLGEPPHRRRSDVKLEGLEIPENGENSDDPTAERTLMEALARVGLS